MYSRCIFDLIITHFPGIYPSSFTNAGFRTKIQFLNVVKCSWGPQGVVSSRMGSWWSSGGSSGGKVSGIIWPFLHLEE